MVFLVVNAALVMVKRRATGAHRLGFRVPLAVPLLGVGVTGAVIGFAEPTVLLTTASLIETGAG